MYSRGVLRNWNADDPEDGCSLPCCKKKYPRKCIIVFGLVIVAMIAVSGVITFMAQQAAQQAQQQAQQAAYDSYVQAAQQQSSYYYG